MFNTGLPHLISSKPCQASQVSPQRQGVPLPHLGRAFTDVQELKQVLGQDFGSPVFLSGHKFALEEKIEAFHKKHVWPGTT